MKKKASTNTDIDVLALDDAAEAGEPIVDELTAVDETPPLAAENPGVFVYLGPSIRGVITNGGIYTGTRSEILSRFSDAVGKYPDIARLIIEDKNVAKTRERLSRGEGAVSIAYKQLENRG